jgi:hypothetical protein
MDCDPIGGLKGGQGGGNLRGFEPILIALRPTRRTLSGYPAGGGNVRISTLWSGFFGAVLWRHGRR